MSDMPSHDYAGLALNATDQFRLSARYLAVRNGRAATAAGRRVRWRASRCGRRQNRPTIENEQAAHDARARPVQQARDAGSGHDQVPITPELGDLRTRAGSDVAPEMDQIALAQCAFQPRRQDVIGAQRQNERNTAPPIGAALQALAMQHKMKT